MLLLVNIVVLLAISVSARYKDPRIEHEYDFIVVGAGAAGCVLANRLSEEKNVKVLVMEAGGDEGIMLLPPVAVSLILAIGWNWGYRAEPNPMSCQETSDKRCPMPRGKVMGGTTAINLMVYTRGSPKDYDTWAALGNPGWSYKEVLPYFLKSEDQTNPEYLNSKYHAVGGPLTISTANYHTPLSDAFLEAGKYLGYPITDVNAEQYGFSRSQGMVRDGRRLSSNRAFLDLKVRKRPNLTISLYSTATRLLLKGNAVIGVEFERKNKLYKVMARKEVIVCAGAFNSPKLLMLSGIGPKEDLKKLGIPVVKNLPVGRNLQDHVGVSHLVFSVDKCIESIGSNEINDMEAVEKWLEGKGGPLSVPGSCEALAYLSSSKNKFGKEWPDFEIYMQGTNTQTAAAAGFNLVIDNPSRQYSAIELPEMGGPAISLIPCVLRPKSIGVVRLKSKCYKDPPIIDGKFFSNSEDVQLAIEGIREACKIMETPMFKKMGAKLNNTCAKQCEKYTFGTDDFWKCWIRTYTALFYHPTSTCKMGPSNDCGAVVNSRLKVHGISKLRVCDLSICPTIPSAHTTAPAIMIGEKAADLIKEDYGYIKKCRAKKC